ncbi:uncharacterized protein [Amphiura filiformis]|uniref:uncharacterized protein n=1 Tax=Amphiura filiformis TaxID=82378 RepID=UPI003B20C5A7
MNESLHSLIRKEYGKDCLKLTKDLEKTARKVANYRNHLRFNLRCLQADVIPRSAKLSSNIKGSRADKIIHSAERKLLNERVRQVNYTIKNLNNKKSDIFRELGDRLPTEIHNRVSQFTEHAQLAQHETTKSRQVEKFGRLATVSRADKDKNWRQKDNLIDHNIKDRWVRNLSDRQLSGSEQSLLEKGLNFAVASKRIQVTDIITATESAIRGASIGPNKAEELRSRKLGVVNTLFHRAESIITKDSDKIAEHQHLRKALGNCGYQDWAINKALNKDNSKPTASSTNQTGRTSITIPYHGDLSEKLKRIYRDHGITTHFKPTNTIRQSLVHPKDKQPKGRISGVVYGVRCSEEQACQDSYIGETAQPLHNRMLQHRRASSSGNDSSVFLHLKATGHHFDTKDVRILDREHRWFERGVKEAIWLPPETINFNIET